jgi:hypothetical protein
MRGFYTIYDMTNKRMGFGVLTGSENEGKQAPYKDSGSSTRTPEKEI